MQKVRNFLKANLLLLLVILISIPTFYRMLRPGIFTMMDFHFFRQLEFSKCIESFQIPCRWAPDAGLGYGEPLFNFYGQFTYAFGELFHMTGFSIVDTVKIVFIVSLVGSAITMFLLAKYIWKNNYAALISSAIYIYTPYRAVDVWVRGAYPEAFAFIFFPLIIYFFHRFVDEARKKWLILLSLSTFLLITTHNLSLVMFTPFMGVWMLYILISKKQLKLLPQIILSLIGAIILSSFYILPVIFESKFVNLHSTIEGYFDYRGHFATIYELFISRFWGYGASLWGPVDDLSLSVGQVQWALPIVIMFLLILFKKIKNNIGFIVLLLMGVFYLFLTHNQSTFIWTTFPFLAYIQFPWRFLGVATFALALSCGAVVNIITKYRVAITVFVILLVVGLNFSFFREDKWNNYGDNYFTTSWQWYIQRDASKADFWPIYGKIPEKTPEDDNTLPKPYSWGSNFYKFKLTGEGTSIKFPIVYFPGWTASIDSQKVIPSYEPKNGLLTLNVPKGNHTIDIKFMDTPVRFLGNTLSLAGFVLLGVSLVFKKKWLRKI